MNRRGDARFFFPLTPMPSYRSLPDEQTRLALWQAWGDARKDEFTHMAALLPGPNPQPDFRLAQALLSKRIDPALLTPPAPRAPGAPYSVNRFIEERDFETRVAPARALACLDDAWGWSPEEIRLREAAFSLSDPSEAPILAYGMMTLPRAPWRRWCCASSQAHALFDALDALGHQEPAIAPYGALSLPGLMGFSGLPIAAWARRIALMSRPEAFVAESAPTEPHSLAHALFEPLLKTHPKAMPALPARQGVSIGLSSTFDAQLCAFSPPERLIRQSALGLMNHPRLPSPQKAFRAAAQTPFFDACLSQSQSGLPIGFDHCWPLAYPRPFPGSATGDQTALYQQSRITLCAQGAKSSDIHNGAPIWEPFVAVDAEQGSEGYFAPIDDESLALFFHSGADFLSTTLRPPDLIRDPLADPQAASPMSLADYYRESLDPYRAAEALAILEPWIVCCHARVEHAELDEFCGPGLPRKAPSL